MAAIGSLLFCTACGNLLPPSTGEENTLVVCDQCGTQNNDTSARSTISRSKPNAFPSAIRTKKSAVQSVRIEDLVTTAVTQQECPKCQKPEVRYYTKQIRSADEGTTVFYECDGCGHKWNTNN